jgi:hypothetical protein
MFHSHICQIASSCFMNTECEVYSYNPAPDGGNGVCSVCPLCRGNVCEPKAVDSGVEAAV